MMLKVVACSWEQVELSSSRASCSTGHTVPDPRPVT
jgi:hypothetical protein